MSETGFLITPHQRTSPGPRVIFPRCLSAARARGAVHVFTPSLCVSLHEDVRSLFILRIPRTYGSACCVEGAW